MVTACQPLLRQKNEHPVCDTHLEHNPGSLAAVEQKQNKIQTFTYYETFLIYANGKAT